jgi:hypothetical protein
MPSIPDAGGRLTIIANQPSLTLTGELVVAGEFSVENSGGSVVTNNLRLNALSKVSVTALVDIDLQGGFLVSQNSELSLDAGRNVLIGKSGRAAVAGSSVRLLATSYTIGSAATFGQIYSRTFLSISGRGGSATFEMCNSASLLQAGTDLVMGVSNDLREIIFGTDKNLPGGRVNAGSAQVRSQGALTLAGVDWNVSKTAVIAAKTDTSLQLRMIGGRLVAGLEVTFLTAPGHEPVIAPESVISPSPKFALF